LIPITVKQVTALKKTTQPTGDKIDLPILPRRGDLVYGLRSEVAFKAINENGISADVKGIITDSAGTQFGSFSTQHLGMGTFLLKPQAGKKYFAKVTAGREAPSPRPCPPQKTKALPCRSITV